MPRKWTVSVRSQRSILGVPRSRQGRSHQVVELKAVEIVWVEEAAGLNARYGVCMGGVSIVCSMGLKQGVIGCRCRRRRRRQRGGTRVTDSGSRMRWAVEECLGRQGIVVEGVIMGGIVPVLVLLPERVVVVLMGSMIVVSQWTSWGRRGSRIAGGNCRTKTVVLLFGVHSGGGQDCITATINGSCTSALQVRQKTSGWRVDGGATDRALDATHVVE